MQIEKLEGCFKKAFKEGRKEMVFGIIKDGKFEPFNIYAPYRVEDINKETIEAYIEQTFCDVMEYLEAEGAVEEEEIEITIRIVSPGEEF